MDTTKKCTKCNNIKSTDEFYTKKFKSGNIGFRSQCKKCLSVTKTKEDENIEKDHQKCNKCNIIKHITEFNKRKSKKGEYIIRKDCKECKNKYNQKYREENLEEIKKQQNEYSKNNRDIRNKLFKNKYHIDKNFKIADNLRAKLKHIKRNLILGKMSLKVYELCSCNNNFLKKWFEYLYYLKTNEELIWDNLSSNYEIDHVIPVCNFDLTVIQEQKAAFIWSNLQVITREENRNKGKRIIKKLIDEHGLKINNFIKKNENK